MKSGLKANLPCTYKNNIDNSIPNFADLVHLKVTLSITTSLPPETHATRQLVYQEKQNSFPFILFFYLVYFNNRTSG